MKEFIRKDMRQRVRDGFSILFPAEEAVKLFRDNLKLFHITAVPQEHQRPRLILNLWAQPYEGTTSVNDTTDREVALELMQFGSAFPRILQAI